MSKKLIGASIAAAAALLFAATTSSASMFHKSEKPCYGVNSCKGKSACKTSKNSCKGKNKCKGQGMELKTAKECKKLHGSTTEPTEKKDESTTDKK